MQMNGCSREVSDQRGRWVQRHAHKASSVYYKEFLRKADFEGEKGVDDTGQRQVKYLPGDST